MKQRDLIKKLEEAGYRWVRDDGGHTIYGKDGCQIVVVPRHREINENLARGILRMIRKQ